MIRPTRTLEHRLFSDGYSHIIAVDEVGMGCLAGPVVACAVALTKDLPRLRGVRDSKLFSPKQREIIASQIKKSHIKYHISYCYPKTIDRINIYQAARRAMARAVTRVSPPAPPLTVRGGRGAIVLVDGPHTIQNISLPQIPIIHGDRRVYAIACASIIAKVYRDRMMARYARRFPQYGFDRHKGYGTAHHTAMLVRYGPSPLHRRSFEPVGKLM